MKQLFDIVYQLNLFATAPAIILDNSLGAGLRVEWEVEKSRRETFATISIYNLAQPYRQLLAAAQAVPISIKRVQLFIGWSPTFELLFDGFTWKTTPERKTDVDVITTLECGGPFGLRDTPPQGGAEFGLAMAVRILQVVNQVGLVASPAAVTRIQAAAATAPITAFMQFTNDGDPHDLLDQYLASIGLDWGISEGLFVVYQDGLRDDLLPSLLAPVSGLLSWEVVDDGGVRFEALAQPRVVPGMQIQVFDEFEKPVGGGPLRVERVSFNGSSDGPSLMSGTARKLSFA